MGIVDIRANGMHSGLNNLIFFNHRRKSDFHNILDSHGKKCQHF
jgi:hypothetical protein